VCGERWAGVSGGAALGARDMSVLTSVFGVSVFVSVSV